MNIENPDNLNGIANSPSAGHEDLLDEVATPLTISLNTTTPVVYLVGDIGGTNTRLQLFQISGETSKSKTEISLARNLYYSPNYVHLTDIVKEFFEEYIKCDEHVPTVACFALAGPVEDQKSRITNLGWNLVAKDMEDELGIKNVIFLNDFAACGYGLLELPESDYVEITNGKERKENAPIAVIGAGTGLGEAVLVHTGEEYIVLPGEGGHCDFSPRTKEEFELLVKIKSRLQISRVGVERVVSGPGIELIYECYCKLKPHLVNENVSEFLRSQENASKYITEYAFKEKDPLCKKAVETFVHCYGAEVGNLACRVLPRGGLFVCGGIAPRILEILKKMDFLENALSKGRMREILAKIPIYVVKNTAIGMLGARFMARRSLKKMYGLKIEEKLSKEDVEKQEEIIQTVDAPDFDCGFRPSRIQQATSSGNPRCYNPISDECKSHYVREKTNGKMTMFSQLGWMAAGVMLSGLVFGSFLLGKRAAQRN